MRTALFATVSLITLLGSFQIAQAQSATVAPSQAAPAIGASNSEQPLEITADTALEWNRDKKQYIARTNAKAVQGDFSVSANTLIADYREGKDGATQIYRLTAEGHAVVVSGTSSVTGSKAVYEVDSGKATVTGQNLLLTGTNLQVTAKEKFEYFANEGKLIAYGRPLVTSGEDTLEADQVIAWTTPQGERTNAATGDLKKAEATGNVVIKTPSQTALGDKATYDAPTSMAYLIGNAKVTSGTDTLSGERAEVNLKTKVSRMIGNNGQGRVKGIFYPVNRKRPTIPAKTE